MSDTEVIEVQEYRPEFAGYNNTGYPGGFPSVIKKRIESLVQSPCLHLFSGSSLIGDVRVDINHENATHKMNVYNFIETDTRYWKWVLLDPDYHISRKQIKLKVHGLKDSVGGNKLAERMLANYFLEHTENVLWLDNCSPSFEGFERVQVWPYIMGGFRAGRWLTWLRRKGEPLQQSRKQ